MVQLFDEEGVRVNFGMAAFRDALADLTNSWEPLGFGREIPSQQRFLEGLKTEGGGNNRGESSMYALAKGVAHIEWPNHSRRKVVALFTDDKGHMPDIGIDSWEELCEILVLNDINQIHLFVTENKMPWYDALSMTPDCLIIRHTLSKNLSQLEKSIREFVKTTSVDILDETGPLLDRKSPHNPFANREEVESDPVLSFEEPTLYDEDDENIFDDDDYIEEVAKLKHPPTPLALSEDLETVQSSSESILGRTIDEDLDDDFDFDLE
ncbi:hypothetical protein N9A87_03455 [Euryarchaeota archaeon]|nr:hypothetical protein [Euryarchaeota archaeon]